MGQWRICGRESGAGYREKNQNAAALRALAPGAFVQIPGDDAPQALASRALHVSAADISHQGEALTTCTGFLRLLEPTSQTGWLKTREFIFSQLEAESLKSRCGQVHTPSQGSREGSFPSLAALVLHGISWLVPAHSNFCLCFHMVLSVCLRVISSSYKDSRYWV